MTVANLILANTFTCWLKDQQVQGFFIALYTDEPPVSATLLLLLLLLLLSRFSHVRDSVRPHIQQPTRLLCP